MVLVCEVDHLGLWLLMAYVMAFSICSGMGTGAV